MPCSVPQDRAEVAFCGCALPMARAVTGHAAEIGRWGPSGDLATLVITKVALRSPVMGQDVSG